jgi:hypothetical protein
VAGGTDFYLAVLHAFAGGAAEPEIVRPSL